MRSNHCRRNVDSVIAPTMRLCVESCYQWKKDKTWKFHNTYKSIADHTKQIYTLYPDRVKWNSAGWPSPSINYFIQATNCGIRQATIPIGIASIKGQWSAYNANHESCRCMHREKHKMVGQTVDAQCNNQHFRIGFVPRGVCHFPMAMISSTHETKLTALNCGAWSR